MSAAAGTRIFGIRVTVDPKIIIGVLVVLAGVLYWVNSGSDDAPSPTATAFNPNAIGGAPVNPAARPTNGSRRGGPSANERGVLRLRPIDATRGDVDPTIRLDLLRRLSTLQMVPATRSLFEVGPTPAAAAAALPVIKKGPIIPVTAPVLPSTVGPGVGNLSTTVNIPLKYYGFVRPSSTNSINSGLFLDGDNVLVAIEGTSVNVNGRRFLVVELTPTSARLEDTQLKQGQTLQVVPVALQ